MPIFIYKNLSNGISCRASEYNHVLTLIAHFVKDRGIDEKMCQEITLDTCTFKR